MVSFSLAVNRRTKTEKGEEITDFLRITAWGQIAKYVHDYFQKGRLIACDGRLQTRKWQDQNGNNRESVEIVADNIYALDRARQKNQNQDESDYDPFAEEA